MVDGSIFRIFAVILMVAGLSGCGRPPEIIGVANAAQPTTTVPEVTSHRIFITTTRQKSDVEGAFFSEERSHKLNLASVSVTVPPTHVLGELERPKRLPPDPNTEFTIIDPLVYQSNTTFISELNRELATFPKGQRSVLLFVHGYNNTTSDAILQLAQFVEDTGFQGVPILFTWASAGKLPRYVYDLNSALIARVKLKELAELMSRSKAEGVNILGHSMGTLLTMEGLVDAQLAGSLGKRNKINNIMLASPDIDMDLFRTQIALLPQSIRSKLYVFISRDDGALRVSKLLAGGVPRAGAANAAEIQELGLNVIDLSEIDDSSSGSHSKFAGSPGVVQLIGAGLNSSSRFDRNPSSTLEQVTSVLPIRIYRN